MIKVTQIRHRDRVNSLNYLTYIATPLVGAVIGYFTNWLAIKMLFRPHKEKRIFNIRIPFTPGLIPKERERLTKKIAETVSAYVLTPEVLAKELSSANIWQGLRESTAVPDITLSELLAKLGLDDPAVYAERALLAALRDERVKQAGISTAINGIHAGLAKAGTQLSGFRDYCVEAIDRYLRGDASKELVEKALEAIRQSLFAEGVTPGGLLPEQVVVALKSAVSGLLPKAVTYIKQWPEDNPWLDEKLSAMVRKIIDDNFGRLIGLFIDHQKVYVNMKDGLFTYLSDSENQQFMIDQINAAMDRFCETECARWADRFPDDAFFMAPFTQWVENGSVSRVIDPMITSVSGSFKPDEWLERLIPDMDEKLSSFLYSKWDEACETSLPKPLSDAVRQLCGYVGEIRLRRIISYIFSDDAQDSQKIDRADTARSTRMVALSQIIEKIAAFIAENMKIGDMVESKINAFAVEEAESLILSVVNRELNAITVLGGVLGFIIGLFSLAPRLFMP